MLGIWKMVSISSACVLNGLLLSLNICRLVSSSAVGLFHIVRVSQHDWENFVEAPSTPVKARTHFECALECQSSQKCRMMKFDGTTCKLAYEVGSRSTYRFPVNSFQMFTENVLVRKEFYLAGENTVTKSKG